MSSSPAPPPPPPAALNADASPRRRHSEIDMPSLRRVSEALLLAQNRARLATERANRSERALRLVLTHVNPQLALSLRGELEGGRDGLPIDTMAEWDMMQSMAPEQPARSLTSTILSALSPRRRQPLDADRGPELLRAHASPRGDEGEGDAVMWASMVAPERNLDVALLAKEIVENLRVAAARGDRRVQKLNASMPSGATFVAGAGRTAGQSSSSSSRSSKVHSAAHSSASVTTALAASTASEKNWLETWKHRLFRIEIYAMTPLQFVAGILVGVVVGMTVTKQLLRRQGGSASQLARRLAACTENPRTSDPRAALRYLPFAAMEEDMSSYYLHQAAVEVA